MANHPSRFLIGLVVLAALEVAPATTGAQTQPGIDELLARVGERIADFYKRAKHVICIETSTVQPIDLNRSPQGFARTVESELRVEADGAGCWRSSESCATSGRVNGRVPREKDKKNRDGCTDPNPLSTEPLAFLLPAHRSEYQFKIGGIVEGQEPAGPPHRFRIGDRRSNPELIEDPGGHDDCFDWTGPLASRGRIWVDAKSYDVLRIERSVGGPVDVRVPLRIQRRHHLDMLRGHHAGRHDDSLPDGRLQRP